MKRFKTPALIAALMSITIAAVGCGSNGTSANGVGGPGSPGYTGGISNPGTITPIGGGAGQIMFSGQNVYDSGVRIVGMTTGFNPNQTGQLILGTVDIPLGQPGTLSGTSAYYPGSTISMVATPVGVNNPLGANIAGVVNLSPQFMAVNFPSGMANVLGLGIDLFTTGTTVYGGTIYICTTRDQAGACHGPVLTF